MSCSVMRYCRFLVVDAFLEARSEFKESVSRQFFYCAFDVSVWQRRHFMSATHKHLLCEIVVPPLLPDAERTRLCRNGE